MTNTAWPSDEDVRKALVALHGHADVFPVHYEQARQALLAGTEGLRAAHDRQIAAKDEAIIALRERTPPMTDTPTPWVTDEEIVDLMADLPANPDIVRDGLWQTRLAKALIDLRDSRALAQSQAATIAEFQADNDKLREANAALTGELDAMIDAYEQSESALASATERLARAEAAFDTTTPMEGQSNCYVSTNALDNLEGVIEDLKHQNYSDKVVLETLASIAQQLAVIEAALTPPKEP